MEIQLKTNAIDTDVFPDINLKLLGLSQNLIPDTKTELLQRPQLFLLFYSISIDSSND